MRVQLIKNDRIRSINIPDIPSGNFWVTDYDDNGKEMNLVNITKKNERWFLLSNQEVVCVSTNNKFVDGFELSNYKFYSMRKLSTDELILIYCTPSFDEKVSSFYANINEGNSITFGSNNANICYPFFDSSQARITFENGKYNIYALSNRYGVYVNNLRVKDRRSLELGDIIFINGIKLIFAKDRNNYKFDINIIDSSLVIKGLPVANLTTMQDDFKEDDEEIDMKWYKEDDYFHKTPRFIS